MYNEDSPLGVKSRAFAVRITNMVDYLQKHRNKTLKPIYTQVLRSGTSIMANVAESEFAQSKADFISKLQIALKEANETKRWLFLIYNSKSLTQQEYDSMNKDCCELIAMLVCSVNTSKKNKIDIEDYQFDKDDLQSNGFVSDELPLNF